MNKTDLAVALSEKTGLTKARAMSVVEAMFNPTTGIFPAALAAEGEVNIPRFGKFTSKPTPAREGRNPFTGENMMYPEGVRVSFRASNVLKDKLKK